MTVFRQLRSVWTLLGGIAGIVLAAGLVLFASSRPAPHRSSTGIHGKLLSEATGEMREVVVHYVPGLLDLVEPSYWDFFRSIGPSVRVRVVLAREDSREERDRFAALLQRIDPTGDLARRTTMVEVDGPITTWSKDRALVASVGEGAPRTLVAPADPGSSWPQRQNDWRTVQTLAKSDPASFSAAVLPLDFDAGDLMIDEERVIVDTNLLAKNAHRGIDDSAELRRRLAALLRMPVLVLGRRFGDTPRHHLAMYMTVLDPNVALVGDVRAAQSLMGSSWELPEVTSESGDPLSADFSEEMAARFELAARELAQAGYRVLRIPNVPFDDKTYISYTNGVFETRPDGARIAYVPAYGVDQLDRAAHAVYAHLGWQVRPIRVRNVFPFHGTIGCLVNVVDRRLEAVEGPLRGVSRR